MIFDESIGSGYLPLTTTMCAAISITAASTGTFILPTVNGKSDLLLTKPFTSPANFTLLGKNRIDRAAALK